MKLEKMDDFGICFLKSSSGNEKTEERFRGYFRGALKCGNILVSDKKGTVEGKTAVFIDGSIYNKSELINEFLCGNSERKTEDLLSEMYDRLGDALFGRLDGSFSIMIYNSQNRQIVAGIDHANHKNMYTYEDNDLFVIANEIKSILVIIGKEKIGCDQESVLSYIAFHRVLGNGTFFKGVKKLLSGQIVEIELVNEETVRKTVKRYWPDGFFETANGNVSLQKIAAELKELLANEVRISLRENESIALALSGGLDSSILAFVMKEVLKKEFIAITGGFKELPEENEIKYAREISSILKIDFYEVYPTREYFWRTLKTISYLMGYPEGGPGIYGLFCISEEAARRNCRVLVHGSNADILLGGSAWITETLIRFFLGNNAYFENYLGEISNLSIMLEYFRRRGHWVFRDCFKTRSKNIWEACYESCVDNQSLVFLRKGISREEIKIGFKDVFNAAGNGDILNDLIRFIINYSLPEDHHAMGHITKYFEMQGKTIYSGKKILEYIFSIPLAYRIPLCTTKPIAREIAQNVMPANMLKRRKYAFDHPIGDWIKKDRDNFLADVMFKSLDGEPFWSILDREKVTAAYKKHCSGEKDYSQLFWQIISIASWFRTFK